MQPEDLQIYRLNMHNIIEQRVRKHSRRAKRSLYYLLIKLNTIFLAAYHVGDLSSRKSSEMRTYDLLAFDNSSDARVWHMQIRPMMTAETGLHAKPLIGFLQE